MKWVIATLIAVAVNIVADVVLPRSLSGMKRTAVMMACGWIAVEIFLVLVTQ